MIEARGAIVVVEPVYETKSGTIIIPDVAQKQNSNFHGIVISIGEESEHRNSLNIGDRVLFSRNEGTKIYVRNKGKEYLALKDIWILAKMEGL